MDELQDRVFTDDESQVALPYRLFVPRACDAEHPCGLLLFLHGAGERGNDNRAQLENHALAWLGAAAQAAHPTIVAYPQCPNGMQWVDAPWDVGTYSIGKSATSRPMSAVLKLLATLRKQLPVDERRLLITGLSMGGYGAFDIVSRYPTMFAGAVVLCGGGDPSYASALKDLPLWVFHGSNDPAVPVRGSRRMVKAIRQAGGDPRYTEVSGGGHDVWNVAYQDVQVLRWLLAQKRP